MNIYIESLMTSKSFMQFEIGKKLDLTSYAIEEDYNPIGSVSNSLGYYFFNREVDVEIMVDENGFIHSVDILLKNQENQLFLGRGNANSFSLNNCRLDDLLLYLNEVSLEWRFDRILAEKSISIVFISQLQFTLYFDFDNEKISPALSLITLRKIGLPKM